MARINQQRAHSQWCVLIYIVDHMRSSSFYFFFCFLLHRTFFSISLTVCSSFETLVNLLYLFLSVSLELKPKSRYYVVKLLHCSIQQKKPHILEIVAQKVNSHFYSVSFTHTFSLSHVQSQIHKHIYTHTHTYAYRCETSERRYVCRRLNKNTRMRRYSIWFERI